MRSLMPLLRGVSRSFYLTLRVLPQELRPRISVAYLLARASDTVADTQVVPREKRLGLLRDMRQGRTESIRGLAADQALPAERELLERLDECVSLKASLPAADRELIDKLLDTIVAGQIFDIERFPGSLQALSDDAELDRYTYMVAGCVGDFWTRMCALHLPELRSWDVEAMCRLGVRFGKGLQLVNVLRDMPRDLRIGRCYLPIQDPKPLLDPASFDSIRERYSAWLDTAVGHLEAGWEYTMAFPPSLWRLRLACAWPILLGLKTIARLRAGNPLDPARVIMVPQWETDLMILRSVLTCRFDGLFHRLFGEALIRTAAPR
ncbi:MAG: squalene/phytoene synthase family protein [Elusimicrobiota bacterium]